MTYHVYPLVGATLVVALFVLVRKLFWVMVLFREVWDCVG